MNPERKKIMTEKELKKLFDDASKVSDKLLMDHGTDDPSTWIHVAEALMFYAKKYAKAGYEKLGTEGDIFNA